MILDGTCSKTGLKFQISRSDMINITGNEMIGVLSYKGGHLMCFRKKSVSILNSRLIANPYNFVRGGGGTMFIGIVKKL